jgi:uncharacterized membrane protein YvlD (DUF360 family)
MSAQDHGHTIAAWAAVSIVLAAFIIGGIAVLVSAWTLFWAAVVLAVVGGVSGKVLQMMGYGQTG